MAVSSPFSATSHHQQQNCMLVYLFHSSTLFAHPSAITAPMHSPSATRFLTKPTKTSNVKRVTSLASCYTLHLKAAKRSAYLSGPITTARANASTFALLQNFFTQPPSHEINSMKSSKNSEISSLHIPPLPDTNPYAHRSRRSHFSHLLFRYYASSR